ncbi:MAG: HWE histidine kinase domain-containing protein [Xanthobacteraceae bacterium]
MPSINKPEETEPRERPARPAEKFVAGLATVRSAFEAGEIGVWSWDVDADEMTWSGNMEAIHGLPAGSFGGTRASFIGHIHRDDRKGVDAALKESQRTGAAFRARYRMPPHEQHDEHWLEATGKVAPDKDARQTMFGLCYDVTGRINLENELRSRAKQQEALAQLGERALAEPGLDRLLNDAVSTVALTLSVDFVKILELLPGGIELLLRAGFGWKSDLVGTVLTTTAAGSFGRFTLDAAGPVVMSKLANETRFEVPQYLVDHCCTSGLSVAIAGHDGRAYGILGVGTARKRHFNTQEIAFLVAVGNILAGAIQRRQLEQRHELMIRDMRHRSGNLFSQLLALFSQTARTSKSIPDLASKYQARVLAMANAHRLITEGGWQSIPIMDLLNVVLGPYIERATLNGPNIDLEPDPVFHFSAALHELAANAIKHGSLSRSKGQLDLSWSASRTQRGMTLTLDWTEKNGPPARRPRKIGFGSRLIDLVIGRQLNGEVTRTFSRKGLAVNLVVPLTHERWPSPAATAASGAERPR